MADDLLRRGYEHGRRLHDALGLAFEDYEAGVRVRLERRAARAGVQDPTSLLRRTHLADLFLVIACERQVPGAWDRFCSHYPQRLRHLLRRIGATAQETDEQCDSLAGHLFSPAGRGQGHRLSRYDGSGTLLGWLAVVATRRLLRSRRRGPASHRRLFDVPDDRSDSRLPGSGLADGELSVDFLEALQRAWAELPDRDRLVLLYRFADELPQRRIAELLGVGAPRLSRILHRALTGLRRVLRREFPEDGWQRLAALWPRLRDHVGELLAIPHGAEHLPPAWPKPDTDTGQRYSDPSRESRR